MRTLAGVAANAGYVLAVQVLALVTLSPADYGAFSIQYLLFAFGSSLSLSLISEAWLRRELRSSQSSGWNDYAGATVWLATVMGVLTLGASLLIPSLSNVAVLGAIAVAASVYRTSARYYSVRSGEKRGVVLADIVGLIVTLTIWVIFLALGYRELWMMSTTWAAGAVATAALSKWPRAASAGIASRWLREHREQIRPLLRDSLLMDLGAIGTPYVLAPVLGLANFGVYRAISNVAAPVRLVLSPLRPRIASAPHLAQRSGKRLSMVLIASLLMGIGVILGLWLVELSGLDLGALSAVVAFALPAAVFVSANFLGTYYYIVARAHVKDSWLLTGRLVQTALAVAGPLLGVLAGGLSGAIWGLALVTVISAGSWTVLALSRRWAA